MVSTNRRKRFDNEKRSRKVKRKKKTNVMDEILREVFSILETLDTLQYMVELHGSIKQSVPSTESHDNRNVPNATAAPLGGIEKQLGWPGPSQEPQGTMGPTVRPDPTLEPEGTMRQWTRGLGRCTSRELQGCFPAKRVAHNQGDRKLHMYLPHCQQQRDSRKEQNVCHWHGGDRRGRRCERSDP
ncbi:hypothetical protein Bbelb_109070 [Branchiostoma belcheri]|nr:hypothetical protein Bbelb_109070 [Branchiostoma belcheri]